MYSRYLGEGLMALFGGFIVIIGLLIIAVLVLEIYAKYRVFQKAGKNGWEAIVPFYNSWVLCEIVGVKWWFFLIMNATYIAGLIGLSGISPILSVATIAGSFAVNYNLAIKFKKDPISYGIGLTLLPVIFYSIFAFSKDINFDENAKVSSYGFITEEKVEDIKNNKETKTSNTENPTKKNSTKKAKFCKNCGAELSSGKFCSNCGAENTQSKK